MNKPIRIIALASLAFLVAFQELHGDSGVIMGNQSSQNAFENPPAFSWTAPTLLTWWNGPNGTADWLGLGKPLNDYGLSIDGHFRIVSFGQVSGGFPNSSGQPKSNFIPEVSMKFTYDFKKIFNVDGLTIISEWRYRNVEGNNPAYAAGTLGTTYNWDPTDMNSGFGMRMQPQMLQYTNRVLTINAGMENPYEQFLQQPLSKIFENNMVVSTKGIGMGAGSGIPVYANNGKTNLYSSSGVGWSSSYIAWGGTLKVKPSSTTYVQSGLYMAVANDTGNSTSTTFTATGVYPYSYAPASYLGQNKTPYMTVPNTQPNGVVQGTKNVGNQAVYANNHGFNTAGAPNNNYSGGNQGLYNQWSGNGLFSMNEIGWTPKFGTDKLEGHYAAGYYIWGMPNNNYTPNNYNQSVPGKVAGSTFNSTIMGIYLQADQMLFRHHDCGNSAADSKSPAPSALPSLSDRGLSMFNEAAFSSPNNTSMPYYFHTGLVYRGPFDLRPADQIGIVLGCGFYSPNNNNYQNAQNTYTQKGYAALPPYTSTQVLEGFYAVQMNKWMYIKPYVQCLLNPAGNNTVGTDWTLGVRLWVNF